MGEDSTWFIGKPIEPKHGFNPFDHQEIAYQRQPEKYHLSHLLYAREALAAGDPEGTIQELGDFPNPEQNDPAVSREWLFIRGEAAMVGGDYAEALQYLEPALAIGETLPPKPDIILSQAALVVATAEALRVSGQLTDEIAEQVYSAILTASRTHDNRVADIQKAARAVFDRVKSRDFTPTPYLPLSPITDLSGGVQIHS